MTTGHILLVDDDPDDREFFLFALEEIGSFIVTEAKDGLEALEYFRNDSFRPDIVFLDINMPRMNGREFLAEFDKHSCRKEIPVVVISTSSNGADINAMKRLNAENYIVKPSSIRNLISEVREKILLHARRLIDQTKK